MPKRHILPGIFCFLHTDALSLLMDSLLEGHPGFVKFVTTMNRAAVHNCMFLFGNSFSKKWSKYQKYNCWTLMWDLFRFGENGQTVFWRDSCCHSSPSSSWYSCFWSSAFGIGVKCCLTVVYTCSFLMMTSSIFLYAYSVSAYLLCPGIFRPLPIIS